MKIEAHRIPSTPTPLPQVDLYGTVHKGLRLALCSLLTRMGSTDFSDPHRVAAVLDDLEGVLYLCESHIAHEEAHIHPAVDRKRPGFTSTLVAEHADHDSSIRELRALAGAVAAAPTASNAAFGRALYLRFSSFVSENLAHMVEEETEVEALLSSLFSTAELTAIHEALIGSIGPDEMVAFLRVMVPASSPEGRFALLSGPRAAMPPAAFEALLRSFRPSLEEADWRDLTSRFAVAA